MALKLRTLRLKTMQLLVGTTQTTVVTNVDNDGTFAGNTDASIPTQKAVKTYVDAQTHAIGYKDARDVTLSFETGEVGQHKLYFPQAATITKVRSQVVKALADTDAGTITGGNSAGASSGGVITHAASAAFGDAQTATPTTNNTVAANSYYYLTTAKTTAGGKALVSVEYTITG